MKAFEKNIRKVEPYVPGEQPQRKVMKLNTNENPYPPAPNVAKVLRGMDTDAFRRYPDPACSGLVKELAEFYGVAKMVFVGVGSDDVLAMCFLTFFNSEKPILFPDITYSFYKVWADLYRIPYSCPELDENFRLVKEDYFRKMAVLFSRILMRRRPFMKAWTRWRRLSAVIRYLIVIVDEAYVDFAGRSALELIDRYDNLIVVQTFSKARSMAGMRIGYAISNPLLIRYLNDAKYSFNSYTMNQTSLICGVEALKDRAYFEECIRKLIETRTWTAGGIKKAGIWDVTSLARISYLSPTRNTMPRSCLRR